MIEDAIAEIIVDVAEVEPALLSPDLPLWEIDVDSLDLLEVAVEVERRYGVRFEDGELKGIASIRSLADLARAHGAGAA